MGPSRRNYPYPKRKASFEDQKVQQPRKMDTEDKKNINMPFPGPAQEENVEDNINVVVQDQSGNTVLFKIKRKTTLRKLMDAYCRRKNIDFNAVRFSFDGTRLKPDQSLSSIPDIQDGDIIDVFTEQQGGQGYKS